MSNLISHATRELMVIGYKLDETDDELNQLMASSVLELLEVFSKQGHSGFSAPHCIGLFSKLASFEPLAPLTGEADEWYEVSDGLLQNKRAGNVFKEASGKAYVIDGKVFRDKSGSCYTNRDSRVYIEFPYTPKTEYVDVE